MNGVPGWQTEDKGQEDKGQEDKGQTDGFFRIHPFALVKVKIFNE